MDNEKSVEPEIIEEQQAEVDYKVKYEESQAALTAIKSAQSGSDKRVSELSAKIHEMELATMSEKEREKRLQEERDRELEQLRLEKALNENKAFALEHLSNAKLDAELVNIINLNSDKDKILESVMSLEKTALKLKEQAIEDFKSEHRPGFKSSVSFDTTKRLTLTELSELRQKDPDAYNSLPDNLRKPVKQKPNII